jgi:hypothetical protein
MIFCWVVTMIAASIGALVLVFGLVSSKGAPQEAAGRR